MQQSLADSRWGATRGSDVKTFDDAAAATCPQVLQGPQG